MLEQFKTLTYRAARTLIGGAPHMSSDQVAEQLQSGRFGYLLDTRSHDILRMAEAMATAYNHSAWRRTTCDFAVWLTESPEAAELLRAYRIRVFAMGHFGDPAMTGFGRVYSLPALPLTPAEVAAGGPQSHLVEHSAATIPLGDQADLPLEPSTLTWTASDCAMTPRGLIQRVHDTIIDAMRGTGATPLWGPTDTDSQPPVIYGTLA
jgi:hypothetical protein|nr:MAG TPA: hypothetical protein [Caudoviricetes sp.]